MNEKLMGEIKKASGGPKEVGNILLRMCHFPMAAEVVAQDLENPDMSLEKCFSHLREVARKKQKGGCYYMGQEETEALIREFYGIPEKPEKTPPPAAGILDLADLMEL